MTGVALVPKVRVELTRGCPQRFLRPSRLPFRHFGKGATAHSNLSPPAAESTVLYCPTGNGTEEEALMVRRTMLIKMKDGLTPQQVQRFEELVGRTPKEIPCVTNSFMGKNLYESNMPQGWKGPWTYVWDFTLGRREDMKVYADHPYHMKTLVPMFVPNNPGCVVERVTFVHFEPKVYSSRNREARPHKQCLIYQIAPEATEAQVKEFDRMMLEMPKAMPLIRNWCLGTAMEVSQRNPWTRIWEWEFMTQGDFQTYLDHKTHMDVVPLFQDPKVKLVATLTNAQVRLERSVITY